MSTQLPFPPEQRKSLHNIRAAMRRSVQIGQPCLSAIGFAAVISAFIFCCFPKSQAAFMTRLAPFFKSFAQTEPQVGSLLLTASPANSVNNRLANNLEYCGSVLTSEQELISTYLARRYHVARAPMSHLVRAAFSTGRELGLDPLLLLAVMAIESRFNPYAESGAGAQGLMQVMAKVHADKFDHFGGPAAALEPLTNLKVGAIILKNCIARGGSLNAGLRLYVGAKSNYDGRYGAKVLAERRRLRAIAHGRSILVHASRQQI